MGSIIMYKTLEKPPDNIMFHEETNRCHVMKLIDIFYALIAKSYATS